MTQSFLYTPSRFLSVGSAPKPKSACQGTRVSGAPLMLAEGVVKPGIGGAIGQDVPHADRSP